MRSGNVAYASVNALHLQAKCEVQAQKCVTSLSPIHCQHICTYIYSFPFRNIISQLQDIIDKLMLSQHTRMPPTSNFFPSEGKPEDLVVPNAPQPLDEENYPDMRYWHEEDWIKHTERQRDRGEVIPRLGFLTDEDGDLVTESRIKIFTSTAKQAWNELYRHRLDPNSWTKKTPKAASYLASVLKTNFAEFCYCDGDWKVERFAIIKYPDWCRDARESGRLTRMS